MNMSLFKVDYLNSSIYLINFKLRFGGVIMWILILMVLSFTVLFFDLKDNRNKNQFDFKSEGLDVDKLASKRGLE